MRKLLILWFMSLALGILPAAAQDETESAFVQMLANIPDTPAVREWFTYIDYGAFISARPGAPEISSFAEFEQLNNSESEEARLFMSALMGVQSGPAFFASSFMQGEDMPDAVGFDLFEIAQAAEYGEPPAMVTVLQGDFDASAVIAAHEARAYTETESGSLTLLCPEAGCDSGSMVSPADRNLSNPFGGNLGRSQPVLVRDQFIASSSSDVALLQVSEAVNSEIATLAEQPDYRAAAEAMSANGNVLQAYFINPTNVGGFDPATILGSRATAEQIEAIRAELMANFVPLPPYTLIGLAHAAANEQEFTTLALVYKDQETAEAAAALFPEHLENYTSVLTQQPFIEILNERGATSIEASVYEASTGRYVMNLVIANPLPGTEPVEFMNSFPAPAMIFQAFVRAYVSRDLGWLATQF